MDKCWRCLLSVAQRNCWRYLRFFEDGADVNIKAFTGQGESLKKRGFHRGQLR